MFLLYLQILSDNIANLIDSTVIPTIDDTQGFLGDVLALLTVYEQIPILSGTLADNLVLKDQIIKIVDQTHTCISIRIFDHENYKQNMLIEIMQVDYLQMDFVGVCEIGAKIPDIDFKCLHRFG